MDLFFCIGNMIPDSELQLIIILLSTILWPLVPVSHLYAIIALCLGHKRKRCDTFTLSYTPPPAERGCWNVRKPYIVAQPFQTSFCPQTKFEVYLGLRLPKQKQGEKSAWVDRARWKDKRQGRVRRNRYLRMTARDGRIHCEVQHKESKRDWDGQKRRRVFN